MIPLTNAFRGATTLAVGLALAGGLAAQSSYTIVRLESVSGPDPLLYTNATGLNELGHVAGISDTDTGFAPFLYKDGQIIDLGGIPSDPRSGGGNGISDEGQVVGWTMVKDPVFSGYTGRPMSWTEAGGMTDAAAGTPGFFFGQCWGVNNSGQLALTAGGAHFYDPQTGFKKLQFGNESSWKAWEINEDGVVCGAAYKGNQLTAFRYESATDTLVPLADPMIEWQSEAYGINDRGDIVGWTNRNDGLRPPVIWAGDGQVISLPIGELGQFYDDGTAEHINNHGDVVGRDTTISPGGDMYPPIGWLTRDALAPQPVKVPLLSLLDAASQANWVHLHPFEINDAGEIVGTGLTTAGESRAFLMTPTQPQFRNLSKSLPGVDGHPVLIGKGDLAGGSTVELELVKAAPGTVAYMCLGVGTIDAPFQGGVMVPDVLSPAGVIRPLLTDAQGGVSGAGAWPTGLGAGLEFVVQFWIPDAAADFGFAASNAISQHTP